MAILLFQEEEGSLIEEQVGEEDDDLTSLSWLVQNKNLLKGVQYDWLLLPNQSFGRLLFSFIWSSLSGINLKPGAAQTSPTSDFAEDGSSGSERSERGDSTSSSVIEPSSNSSGSGAVTLIDVDQSVIQPVKTSKLKHPHHIPYDPLVSLAIYNDSL